jgi:hypothetical protein
MEELGNSLDVSGFRRLQSLNLSMHCLLMWTHGSHVTQLQSLDVFSELVTASIDYADAQTNDYFMPGDSQRASISPVLDVAKLQKIKSIVERIKMRQSWQASGLSQ